MIAYLEGHVMGGGEDYLTIRLGGMGLRVFVPLTLRTQTGPGAHLALHTHLVVREDLLALYGFETPEERDLFVLLLGANGVGPRIALTMLSVLSVDAIRRAVLSEQSEVFARVPGVGKKTAQKILLHLQGKISGEGLADVAGMGDADAEVLEALTSLGYSVVEAQAALQSIPRDAVKDVEERLRLALQYFNS